MIIAGTGHRPEKCEDEAAVRIKSRVKLQYTKGVSVFITGMAAGFDLWAADEARLLGIELWAAKPWAGHQPRKEDTELYERIIASSSRVVNVDKSETYKGPWQYHKRNEWMVDHCDALMAYWNGEESGGTFACREYAKSIGKPVANIYHDPPF